MRERGKPPMARPVASAIAVAGASALAARGAYAGLRRWPPAGEKTWARSNHRGEPVTLLEGPAVAVGAVTAQVMGQFIGAARRTTAHATSAQCVSRPVAAPTMAIQHQTERWRASAGSFAMAGLGALAFGVLDDLRGSAARRGLRGHLGALTHGEVTTGTVKLAGLAASGLGAALLEGGAPVDVAINTGLIAGGANLLNLFDLRPGRAIKAAALWALLITAAGRGDGTARAAGLAAVAAPAGAALALLPADLAEQAMLGDAGANALGALLGAAAARSLPRRARLCLLGGIAALTVASEKVSFTKVIAASPPLNWLDMLGRRPPQPAPSAGPASAASSSAASAPSTGAPSVPPPRRRTPGRHRRSGDGESRSRSGAWLSALAKTVARQEP